MPSKTSSDRRFEAQVTIGWRTTDIEDITLKLVYQDSHWRFSGLRLIRNASWDSGISQDDKEMPTAADLDRMPLPINIDKAIQEASKLEQNGCGDLANFLIRELVRMKFEFVLGMKPM